MIGITHWVAPKDMVGFAIRFVILIAFLAVSNGLFQTFFDHPETRGVGYLFWHAFVVSGPLIVLFLAVSLFQIRLQRELWQLSRKDGLTGLYNRRTFFDLTTFARAQKKDGVLMVLDADRFKQVNDAYGHQVGDACLRSIAYTLLRNVRQNDVVGRIGGEEFAIYMHDTTVRQASAVGERLTKPIPFRSDAMDHLTVTLSIGAAVSDNKILFDEVFARADGALYEAKLSGRAQMVIWDENIKRQRPPMTA